MSFKYSTLDSLIRAGKAKEARRQLKSLVLQKPSRTDALELATHARRLGQPELGIRLLNPTVRPRARSPVSSTPAEKAEYAGSLIQMGAIPEALELLGEVTKNEAPQAYLFEAFAHFAVWNYKASIPLLKRYLSQAKLDPYQTLVGQVNLIAAMIHERDTAVHPLLTSVMRDTKEQRLLRLHGNCLELQAQDFIFESNFKDAAKALDHAETFLKESKFDLFFLKKWQSVLQLLQKDSATEIFIFRRLAAQRKHWESVRDADRFLALKRRDETLYTHLYFGTPFEHFRDRLIKDWGKPPDLPQNYHWKLSEGKNPFQLDLSTMKDFKGMKQGQALTRLLKLLTSDFYRPWRLPNLYASLYPGEFFHPTSSPTRIHQLMRRLRSELKKKRWPLLITEDGGSYQLSASKPIRIAVSLSKPGLSRSDSQLEALQLKYVRETFAIHDVMKILSLPERSASRLLKAGLELGRLTPMGAARSRRYHF